MYTKKAYLVAILSDPTTTSHIQGFFEYLRHSKLPAKNNHTNLVETANLVGVGSLCRHWQSDVRSNLRRIQHLPSAVVTP